MQSLRSNTPIPCRAQRPAGVLLVALASMGLCGARQVRAADSLDFNRDVRPILANHCFKCHGPDDKARQAGLRLDHSEGALAGAESGAIPVVPGKPDESEVVKRIFATDASERMPPESTNKPLSDEQRATLKQWVAAGAHYAPHWAFVAPVQVAPPAVRQTDWPRGPIDSFILAKIEAGGLTPSPEADKYTLARRLYLDLIGLPPTPAEVDAFVADTSPGAYEALVDRLLSSPHYGERWARRWLDLARYADTNGYEKDRSRSIWPFRDWVISALNADLPFDQFTIAQLAGDLLPNATLDDRIATGFHRNTMLNEEGGIDPLEFRFHAMVDRVATTGTVWLGLTIGCAQCHTHKYDPIPHADYYRLMAFLNNADEPEMDVTRPEIVARRTEITAQVAAEEASLAEHFPTEGDYRWTPAEIVEAAATNGTKLDSLGDGTIKASGENPESDTYTIRIDSNLPTVSALRIEALPDPDKPKQGPGRTPQGNFVLTEIAITALAHDATGEPQTITLASAMVDFAQDGFPAEHAFDGNEKTGWAIDGPQRHVPRNITFRFAQPWLTAGVTNWTVRLAQNYGGHHTLGRFRIQLGEAIHDDRPEDIRRKDHLARKFQAWEEATAARARKWQLLTPLTATSDVPKLAILPDASILASGDLTKRDVYRLSLKNTLPRVTAVRIEALPDESLPKGGPGRIWYEGPIGDFFLSEITVAAAGKSAPIKNPSESFAAGKSNAAAAIDGDPQTGWSINGGQGRAHTAVFPLDAPIEGSDTLDVELVFERYYAASLGRFRVWVTDEQQPVEALATPTELEAALLVPAAERSPAQEQRLLAYFLSIAPELESERAKIAKLREQMPAYPTTLVMHERPADNPRRTTVHNRGEFLQPTAAVNAELPGLFAPLAADDPHNRLSFARWLTSERNPLVARVTVNRHWAALFGRGLVRTTEDFGYQGEPPTHPELLDSLAVEFMRDGWSVKRLHKRIVTSATYRQSSRATPEMLEHDPQNKLLAHAPRVRLDAELVRDAALRASGLLAEKVGGPSVFPPQPANVSSEGAYGPLSWNVSSGEDRYRRGMYTFSKRTAPYAMFLAFDAPSGEACLARREMSNTPLQSLTLLNDAVFVEAAQALGKQLAEDAAPVEARIVALFRRCTSRPPTPGEEAAINAFFTTQRERLKAGELDAAAIAGSKDGDPVERAAWTLAARAVLNLDETITKE